jgi:predicted tellurium resistance membrane protein TerC
MPDLFSLESLVAFVTLTALEIVLGIDNIVFIAIITGRLKPELQAKAQRIGLGLALVFRILLLLAISWVMGLTAPLFSLFGCGITGRDFILLIGGVFLIGKGTHEIHAQMEGGDQESGKAAGGFMAAVATIGLMDIIFSLDSVITAVGMARRLEIMIAAVVCAVIIMIIFAKAVSDFVNRHPTMRVLALAFLILIGVMLTAEGMGQHVNKGYIYFAMAFSLAVELVNMRVRNKSVSEQA